ARIAEGGRRLVGGRVAQRVVLFLRARLRAAAHKSLAVDESGAEYGNVFESLAPDEAVVPVAVSEVLILVPTVRLRRVVLAVAVSRVGGGYGRASVEVARDVAVQTNRARAISSGGDAG